MIVAVHAHHASTFRDVVDALEGCRQVGSRALQQRRARRHPQQGIELVGHRRGPVRPIGSGDRTASETLFVDCGQRDVHHRRDRAQLLDGGGDVGSAGRRGDCEPPRVLGVGQELLDRGAGHRRFRAPFHGSVGTCDVVEARRRQRSRHLHLGLHARRQSPEPLEDQRVAEDHRSVGLLRLADPRVAGARVEGLEGLEGDVVGHGALGDARQEPLGRSGAGDGVERAVAVAVGIDEELVQVGRPVGIFHVDHHRFEVGLAGKRGAARHRRRLHDSGLPREPPLPGQERRKIALERRHRERRRISSSENGRGGSSWS